MTIALAVSMQSVSATEFKLWVRSFIPKEHENFVTEVPLHPGVSMVSGPLPGFSDCFLTDQRDFSDEPSVTSRISAYAKFRSGGLGSETGFVGSESVEIDCEDGSEECRKTVDTSRSTVTLMLLRDNQWRFRAVAAANDACFTGAPDLNFDVTIIINPADRSVQYSGSVDEFPSFEAILKVDNGAAKPIFRVRPKAGSTAYGVLRSRQLEPGTVSY